jgi:hypothetical protein
MANVKITDLTAATALGGSELFETVQSGSSVKASATQIKTFVGDSLNITGGVLGSVTINNAVGEFDSITITAGAVPFSTITGRAYGSFESTNDQSAVSANVTYLAAFNSSASFNTGITVASSTNITLAAAGVYECSFSVQLANSDSSNHKAVFWVRKNGTNVNNTGTEVVVPKAADGGVAFFEFNFIEQVTAGQYLQVAWQVVNTAVKLDYTAAAGDVPGIPSIIFIANRIA